MEVLIPGLRRLTPLTSGLSPKTPVLDLLSTRAKMAPSLGNDVAAVLLRHFGVTASAPYCLAADDPRWDRSGFWMHADPVHLRADRDLLRLFDARHLGISRDEADQLIADLNRHFAAEGLRFSAPHPSRWYLHAPEPPALEVAPLEAVRGRGLDGFMPRGADASRWTGLMNEAQMLLFQSDANRRREIAGRPMVNGVWIWGGGRWGPAGESRRPDRMLSDLPLARGLADAAGIPCEPLSEAALETPAGALAVSDLEPDPMDDGADCAAAIETLDRWLRPALRALRAGRLDRVVIDACDGEYRWSARKADLRRFWLRPRPICRLR
jgi:hypothetical protein